MEALSSGSTGNHTRVPLFCDLCNAELSLHRGKKSAAIRNTDLTTTRQRGRSYNANIQLELVRGGSREAKDDTTDALTFKVTVKEQLGHSLLVYGRIEESQIVASLDSHSRIDADSSIHLKVNLDTLHVFDPETGRTLV